MNVESSPLVLSLDQKVENLVEMLLELGDEQLQVLRRNMNLKSPLTGKPLSTYEPVKDDIRLK